MTLDSLLTPEFTFCNVSGGSKKRLLETSADLIAEQLPQISANQIYEALIAREQLGSTGLGDGIAIPHCRIARLQKPIGSLVKLQNPIDFDAIDQKPVDLLFFLLVPENTLQGHLEALKTIAEHFSNPRFCQNLRAATNSEELYHAAMTSLPGNLGNT